MILELLKYVIKILFAYLFSDFLMGVYHWIKDTYFTPFTPIIGKTFIWGSRLHHVRPRHVLEINNLDLITNSLIWTLLWIIPLMLVFGINVFILVLLVMISLNDVIHKYAHMRDFERPKLATLLQNIKLIQSHDQHHLHHIEPHNINYCPMTPYVNFPLEKINFWRNCEKIIEKIFKIKPRNLEIDFVENQDFPAGIEFINNIDLGANT